MGTLRVQQTDSPIAPAAGFTALSFPVTGSKLKWVDGDSPSYSTTIIGGTSASYELTIGASSTIAGSISGGGTVATGGFTLTVPATGTAALLGTANVFTAAQTINGAITANAGTVSGIPFIFYASRSAGGLGMKVSNTSTNGTTLYTLGEDTGASTTPGYLARYGSTHATLSNLVEVYSSGSIAITPAGGNVSINTTVTTTGKLSIDQSSSIGAIPVLYLDQGDTNEDFIEIVGNSTTGNDTSISTTAAGAFAGRMQITVNGTRRWISFTADA